MFCYK